MVLKEKRTDHFEFTDYILLDMTTTSKHTFTVINNDRFVSFALKFVVFGIYLGLICGSFFKTQQQNSFCHCLILGWKATVNRIALIKVSAEILGARKQDQAGCKLDYQNHSIWR